MSMIVVVDDDVLTQQTCKYCLEAAGYKVVSLIPVQKRFAPFWTTMFQRSLWMSSCRKWMG